MKEQFDKELRDHIKDTFDVFDDGLAHDGWKHYRRQLRNKKRRVFLMWSFPTGIAAAITFFLLMNLNQTEPVINETMLMMGAPEITSNEKVIKENQHGENGEENIVKKPFSKTAPSAIDFEENIPATTNKASVVVLTNLSESSVQRKIMAVSSETDSAININTIVQEQAIALNTEQPVLTIPKSIFAEEEPIYSSISNEPNSSFAYTDKKDNRPITRKLKNVKVSVDASTFMNFSKEGINDDVNLAVGFVSEYKLSKNFSINSGINLNRQTASFVHNIAAQPLENTQNAMALTNSIASVINGHFTNARLVGLDIPIAVKYSTGGRKLNWFVSTGFSSYTLLNEKYFNNFSVINYGFAGVETQNVTTEEEHTDKPFSNFQLARSINFSTGISFPVKNVTTLSIEPFIKYPLRSFGQERLSLGSGGISFKMNLNKNMFKY